PSAAPVATPSNSPRTQRMPGTRSSAATKCISDVPGFVKQTSTFESTKVRTRLSAPFIAWISSSRPMPAGPGAFVGEGATREAHTRCRFYPTDPVAPAAGDNSPGLNRARTSHAARTRHRRGILRPTLAVARAPRRRGHPVAPRLPLLSLRPQGRREPAARLALAPRPPGGTGGSRPALRRPGRAPGHRAHALRRPPVVRRGGARGACRQDRRT